MKKKEEVEKKKKIRLHSETKDEDNPEVPNSPAISLPIRKKNSEGEKKKDKGDGQE